MQLVSSSRQAYLDWLRIAAILGVVFFHAAQPFVEGENWHITNKERSDLFSEFNFWLSRFRMPLLFFISGAVSYYMLIKYDGKYFIKQRFLRLMIPLLFGMLVIVPPQIYMERIASGYKGSYWQFWLTIFEGRPYPKGNTSWHHLWFILYLFVYDLISVPLFKWLLFGRGKRFTEEKLGWLAKGKNIYLLMIPSMVVYASMILKFPTSNDLVNDWAMLIYWYLFVILGYLVMCNQQLVESMVRNRRFSMLLAFGSLIFINYFRWNDIRPSQTLGENWQQHPLTYLYLAVYPLIAWSWIMMLVGYVKKYADRPHRIHKYVNEAIYPYYILHQTVIVILAYYVVQVQESVLAKNLFIVCLTFAVCFFIYHIFIRPYNIARVLFGMKPKKKQKNVAEAETSPSANVMASAV
ncbi:MAG: acyltransferase family protein [Chitinophagaceae bacterium]|nr:acyltransferase family protein [Chitinophagaceae bacterium]